MLSVVVPAYGTSPYLTETLTSLVAHLPADCPIGVQDDASSDDAVRSQVVPFHGRVEYWRNEENLGVSGAFNRAAGRVKTSHVLLVGPDDRGVPGMYDVYADALGRWPEAAAVHPAVVSIDSSGAHTVGLVDRTKALLRPRRIGLLSGQPLATSLLWGNWTYNPSIAWRTSFVAAEPFDTDLHTAMDLDLLLRLALAGESLALVDGLGLEYRRHSQAVSSVNAGRKRLTEELAVHSGFRDEAGKAGWRRATMAARLAPTARAHGLLQAVRPAGNDRLDTIRLTFSSGSRDGSP